MKKSILLLTAISLIAYADFESQTDWSGGAGTQGPVITFGNQFHMEENIFYCDSFQLMLEMNLEHSIVYDYDGAWCTSSSDIDGDGFKDILRAAWYGDYISWWKNINGLGTSWIEYTIDGSVSGASSALAFDVNGDGYLDILGASYDEGEIAWWENANGSGTSWTKHMVAESFHGAFSTYSVDVNGDGYMDVLGAARNGNEITWWENVDGSGASWVAHTVDGDFDGACSVHSEDVDGDGYVDVLGTAVDDNIVAWWENVDGSGTSWVEHTIDGDFHGACSARSADINGDGYIDVLAAGYYYGNLSWWENVDGSGEIWIEHSVTEDFDGAYSVNSSDLNGDGWTDILGAAYASNEVTWWQNTDGFGTSWSEHTIDSDFHHACSVYPDDFNGDGKVDVLGSAIYDGGIAWWDLNAYHPEGTLESSILYTQSDPDWQLFDWNCSTPPGTSIRFQVRASDDYAYMGFWSDTLSSPGDLEGILSNDDSYFQYRAILQTTDPAFTPTLNDITVFWNPVSVEEAAEPVPQSTCLLSIYPNPSPGFPVIRFYLPEPGDVNLSVKDLTGRVVHQSSFYDYSEGFYQVQLSDEIPPGVYFYLITSAGYSAEQRFVVVR